jgi:YEATS domain-containing protein 4
MWYMFLSIVIEKPPFEVTERGWGEFEIEIILCFRDEMRSSVSLVHLLRIFHVNEDGEALLIPEPLVAQFCDEVVFPRPLPQFRELLHPIPEAAQDFPLSVQPAIDQYGTLITEEDGIRLYSSGIQKVEAMIEERMKELEEMERDGTGPKKK